MLANMGRLRCCFRMVKRRRWSDGNGGEQDGLKKAARYAASMKIAIPIANPCGRAILRKWMRCWRPSGDCLVRTSYQSQLQKLVNDL